MSNKWSLYLGRFSGIKIYIHWTFLILIIWIFIMHSRLGQGWSAGLWGVVFILALFACVVLHEMGHALTARRFHIGTRDITIYPIGGVASLEAMPEKPAQELLVAIAGPAVNVLIAGLLFGYLSISGTMPDIEQLDADRQVRPEFFVFNLFAANVALVVFNLIPAFPMDGGRILRAMLAFKINRAKATRISARIGQFLAIVFVFLGFFYNFWLVFIGLFIYLGAGGEAAYESVRNALSGFTVRDALMTRFTTLLPNDDLEKAARILLDGQEQEFLITEQEQVQGILTRKELIHGLSKFGKNSIIANVMRTDFLTLTPDMNLQDVYAKMMSAACTVFPVLDNGKLVGMIDRENISELILIRQAIR
jgi:Zn-dependent protease/predicted transcriptional regulator